MKLTNKYQRLPCTSIKILRDSRQRKEISTEGLKDSIAARGVLSPIIITRDLVLVAGERRLTSSLELGLPDIPCRFVEDLDALEAHIIELEENYKRSDLTWQDQCRAIAKLHAMFLEQEGETWTAKQTAQSIGVSDYIMSVMLRLSEELHDPKIANATGYRVAYNLLTRVDQRRLGDAISDIMEGGLEIVEKAQEAKDQSKEQTSTAAAPKDGVLGNQVSSSPKSQQIPGASSPSPESILCEDFLSWASQYTGPKFSFIHCDFPYGIDYNSGPQSGKHKWENYEDSPDIYWALCKALCENLDTLMAHSGHLMFWFSMDYYQATLDFFTKHAPGLKFNTFPLVWTKSDNVGILPDPKRGPRRVYETALIASREDRFIVKAVGNSYSAPTNKDHHPSTKPEPVLRHFFQMFVDEHTRMLDPTCGGGSALRAAESLGASFVLGLEKSPEYADAAKSALRSFRALRKVTPR